MDLVEVDDKGRCSLKDMGCTKLHPYRLLRLFAGNKSSLLVALDLSHNFLRSLDDVITVASLSSLQELNVARNNISCIPDGIGRLKKLRILKLNDNRITRLPATIGQCRCLEVLILSENKLVEIPSAVAQCTRLKLLRLRNNDIQQLPPELSRLSGTIQEFDVSGNNDLAMIPEPVRDNPWVIMLILNLKAEKQEDIRQIEDRREIREIEGVLSDTMTKLVAADDAIAAKQEEIRVLEKQKDELKTDLDSLWTHLSSKRFDERCKAEAKAVSAAISYAAVHAHVSPSAHIFQYMSDRWLKATDIPPKYRLRKNIMDWHESYYKKHLQDEMDDEYF